MKIKFNPISEEIANIVPAPLPAIKNIPEWYKKIPKINKQDYIFTSDGSIANRTVKHCMPFYDAITSGYVQSTWMELYIKENQVIYPTTPEIFGIRNELSIPISNEYLQIEFTWHMPWMPELPKGYSVIITHPFNRIDLPFFTLSGIIDSDTFTQSRGRASLPFYIKKSFTGIIPINTPMYQIIPIKRENWHSEINEYSEKNNKTINFLVKKYFANGYKKNFWQKKNYK